MTPAPPDSPELSELPVDEPAASTFDTAPIVGIDEAMRMDAPGDDPGADRATQARAHEAAAEVLADRGDWRRAYQHLRAAMALVHLGETPPVHVPEQLRREVDRLRRERAEAREQSRRDSLTATWNRRYLDERLSTLRDESPEAVCVALVDVDHFKLVNDTYGHAVGDSVLRSLVTLMRDGVDGLAPDGFCARYGGEEFALVLTGASPENAVQACEAIRARVEEHDWAATAADLRVTVSVGLGCLGAEAPGEGGVEAGGVGTGALDRVDELLYVAKRTGRNAVAFRDPAGRVRLAGPASGRRGVDAVARAVCEPDRSRVGDH
ncbi:GGDEF domain-containing protein [Actinomycetospora endophytica]|uniref:GGDEF domain-containing protein n=1 Tax=Actinomycetospora endophytica TaxID=2291215 RepID=A0ABS8P642_9PSEU|nr:GGDEF domain-containing protein [Actinomycetospora endophytica]MCD2192866.1 GGDEF domain-containing protein [Actinomycetospora endophytica]